jgi:hypothetical protein
MLLCLKCSKVYNQKTIKNNQCKVKECFGEVVEIDELFIPVIAELNRKSYKTLYCCSGHAGEHNPNSYIYFDDNVTLSYLPEGYLYDQDMYPNVDWNKWKIKNTIRKLFDSKKNMNELSKDIFKNAINVLKWAEGLEDLNDV